ncbi:MAG: F0F1 ATP synthase subunit B [Anaerolineae bacterium]|nr:F0F1 ATP synthase subunit B [Anaerolineae bacterium]
MEALNNLGINLGYFLVQVTNFLIIMVVLRAWVYKPILGLLEKRRESIAKGLEDARVASEARANAEKEAEKVISDAQSKASDVVREATQRAEEATKDIKASAETDAAKAREEAVEEAQEERNRVLGDVRGQVAALAIAAAQKLVGEALTEKRQRVLIDEFFSGVKTGKVTVLEGAKVDGDSAVVTSALPLTKKESDTVKKDVLTALGSKKAEVSFEVDPSILGGLVVRVGDKVLDGSVAGQLDSMRQSLR